MARALRGLSFLFLPLMALAIASCSRSSSEAPSLSVLAAKTPQRMVIIPEGAFRMGSSDEALALARRDCKRVKRADACDKYDLTSEQPGREVHLPAFAMDLYEVTRGEYLACVQKGRCRPPEDYAGLTAPELPVVGVSWKDGADFCAFVGKRLPTEAEWEKAARGDRDERIYPWGDDLDCQKANFGLSDKGLGLCSGINSGQPTPPGRYPQGVSPYGIHDLAGNVWEWVQDWYGPYPAEPLALSAPQGPAQGTMRVLKGGSFNASYSVRVSKRHRVSPDFRANYSGFRCAWDPSLGGLE